MSTKIFCDACEADITDAREVVSERYRPSLQMNGVQYTAEVMISNGVWNSGHLCSVCLLRLINEGREIQPSDGAPNE